MNLKHALLLMAMMLAPASAVAQASAISPAATASYQQGVDAVRQQNWELALQQFLAAQTADPNSPPILFNLGLVSEKIPGHQLRAIAWLQAYLLAAPAAADADAVHGEVGKLEAAYEDSHRAVLTQLDAFVPQAKNTIAQMSPSLGADWAKTANSYFPYAAMDVASSHYLMADEPGALRVLRGAGIEIFPGGRLVLPPSSGLFYGVRHLVTGMLSNHLHADEILGAPGLSVTRDEVAQVDYLIEFGDLDRAKLLLERGVNGDLWILAEERLLCAAHARTDQTLFNQVRNHMETMLLVARAQYNTKTPYENQAIANLSDGRGIPDLIRLYLQLGETERAKTLDDSKLDNSAVYAVADSLMDDFQKGRIRTGSVCPAELSLLTVDDPPTWGSGDTDPAAPPAPLWWSTGRLDFLTDVGRNGVSDDIIFGRTMSEQRFDEVEDLVAIQKVGAEIAASPQFTVTELETLFEFEFKILNTYRMVRGQGRPD
ncbi:MAG TPA: hypothetical protein VIJ94_05850 [Caulobacteraceae bacterium]